MRTFCIVIPTSDSLATLPAAVESALAQEYEDFVVHVSDNASKDGSADYLAGLVQSRLSVACHAARQGKTENWNRAFRTAPTADVFVMLHSDDVLFPGALQAIARSFAQHPSAALVFGNHDILSVDGRAMTPKRIWPFSYTCGGRSFDRLQVLLSAVSIVGCAFPRSLFERVGGFPTRYDFYQDMEFFRQLGRHGPAVYVPEKFGLNRSAPPRPLSRFRYYCEEQEWLAEADGVWPTVVRGLLRKSWARAAEQHLASEHAEQLRAYQEFLNKRGMCSAHSDIIFPRLLTHRLYKAMLTICSFIAPPQ